jgi:hypothetical protein
MIKGEKMKSIDKKAVFKTLRLSKAEFTDLQDEAARAGLNFSDYIRYRLFDAESESWPSGKPESTLNCDFEKEMLRLTVRTYGLTALIAHKALGTDILSDQELKAARLLRKWGVDDLADSEADAQ